jgi:hypothetical protein
MRFCPPLAVPMIALFTACGATTPLPLATELEQPSSAVLTRLAVDSPLLVPGEQMTWELSLGGILGGEAMMAVGTPGEVDGRRIVILRSRIESAGLVAVLKQVRDEVTTWIDPDTGLPVYLHADVTFGERAAIIESNFSSDGFQLSYARKGGRAYLMRQKLPAGESAHDAHSVLGALRAWEPGRGARAYFYILSGRHLWRNTMQFAGREAVKTGLGRMAALRFDAVAQRVTSNLAIDPHKKPRQYSVWLSDDQRRLPVLVLARTEYGDVKVELTDYRAPDSISKVY